MIDAEVFRSFCQELDVVENIIYCVVNLNYLGKSQIRIEVMRSLLSGGYHTQVYIKAYHRLSLDGQQAPENLGGWVSFNDFPWTNAKTADDALRSALSFLHERCKASGN